MARCFICTSQITVASCRKSFSSNYLEHTQSSQHKILLYNRCSWFSQLYTLHVVAQCIITKSEFFLLYFLVIIAHYNTKKQEKIKTEPGVKIELVTGHGLLQAFRWWGAGKKLTREKIGLEKVLPQSPLVFLFALAAYNLTRSPVSKRLEQATLAIT